MCLVVAFAAAPTAGAAGSAHKAGAANKSSAAAKSANAPATSAQSRRTLARRINSVRRRTTRAERRLRTLGRTVTREVAALRAAIASGDTTIDNKINTIVATVTPVLVRLGEGLTQVGDGLLALKTGVETLAAATTSGFAEVSAGFDEVEAALTDIGDFLGSTEYGFGQVYIGATKAGGAFVVTPNVPDDVQQAQTHQRFQAASAGDLEVRYGVRSNENDGTGASNPAAHCKVQVTNEDSSETAATAPNIALGGAQFQPVNDKSAVTSTAPANAGFPFSQKEDAVGPPAGEEDKVTAFSTTVTVAAGDVYFVDMSCVDISPDPDDPEA
jgi:hypothetical protein